MNFKIILSFFVFSSGASAFANNWYDRGNGGFVISCPDQQLKVLDAYETEFRYFLPLLKSQKNDALEIAEEFISRLDHVDKSRADTYRSWLSSFYDEALLLSDEIEFSETPDLGLVRKPKECSLIQVVFQREPSRLNPPRYIINKSIWDSLDAQNRAALIVHELIYRDFLSGYALESTSERIRLFNALLLSNKFAQLTLEEYLAILQNDLHVSYFTYNGIRLYLGATDSVGKWRTAPVSFYSPNEIRSARFAANQVSRYPGLYYFCMSSDEAPDGGSILFNGNGTLKNLSMASILENNPLCAPPSMEIHDRQGPQIIYGNKWEFNDKGLVTAIMGTTANSIHSYLEYKGMAYERKINLGIMPSADTYFRFDEKQNLVEVGLGGKPCVVRNLSVIRFEPTNDTRLSTVLIDKDGQVITKLNVCSY